MLADLWGQQGSDAPSGASTTGSSEAVMLAGLAMKRAWQERNSCYDRPLNIVVGSNAHACVFKFADYFGVETRVVPVTAGSNYVFDPQQLEHKVDCQTSMAHRKITILSVLTTGNSWCRPYSRKYIHRPLRSCPGRCEGTRCLSASNGYQGADPR